MRCVLLIGLAGVLSLAAEVGAQDLAALLAEADTANPAILTARGAADAAAARVPQAGALPDPTLGVGVMNLRPGDPRLGADMMTMASVGLGMGVPYPGKRRLREAVARMEAEAAAIEVERVRLEVAADLRATYYRVYSLDRALELTRSNRRLLGDLVEITAARYGAGRGAQPDVLRAQVERSGLDQRLAELDERRTAALAGLRALLGRPVHTALDLQPAMPGAIRAAAARREPRTFAAAGEDQTIGGHDLGSLQRLALEHNPALRAHRRRVEARERALDLAGKARLPDFQLSAGYGHRAGAGDFVNLMVTAPIPVFAGRKQDQQVVEAAATLAEHEAMHAAMVNDLMAGIARLVATLDRARSQLLLLQDGILPQARTSLASATGAYRVGAVDFPALLDAQVALYRHELDYHRLLADFAADLAALERAVGTEVLP